MSVLWTKDQAVAATGGTCAADWQASGVSIDTRSLQKGDLFVALTDARDGHDFVAQALEKGAAAALVSRIPDGVSADAPLLIVDDVLQGLEAMGVAARARISGKVIGVTGSVGKTGTKEMLRTALKGQGRVHAAQNSYNNHWGVPLTLARMPQDTEFAVIEIGMNHAGEIKPLARMADLDVALITNVAPVHLAAFSGVEEIALAKAEIFEGLKRGGTAVLNADIDTLAILQDAAENAGAQIVTFGGAKNANFRLLGAYVSDDATKVVFDLAGQKIDYRLAAPGAHLAMNSLAVLAACDAVGADFNRCLANLATWTTPAGRGKRETVQMQDGITIELIDEGFNANPTSMAAALDVLAQLHTKGRKVVILGDMLELGKTEKDLHKALADLASLKKMDVIHLVGPLMKGLYAALPKANRGLWVKNADQTAQIIELIKPHDIVMVKGSKGSKVSKIVDAIRKTSA
ncbi:MAG: UDP-N-acetylmuramoyl-tripeptide--D-alanyl-D-alanine ligase [Amylibacter sp.]|nr:UDP-N-acetylmuramoyl-tripeptide--D-alanyl-D-alanine ligase [Amylibacter sp.]